MNYRVEWPLEIFAAFTPAQTGAIGYGNYRAYYRGYSLMAPEAVEEEISQLSTTCQVAWLDDLDLFELRIPRQSISESDLISKAMNVRTISRKR